MNYMGMVANSPVALKKPLVWQMPGTSRDGKTVFYNGSMCSLGQELKKLTDKKILLITGKHLLLSEMKEILYQVLDRENLSYDVISDIPPEPHLDTVEKIAVLMDTSEYGAVVGIGGGSVMDIAKIAAHGGDGKLLDRAANDRFTQKRFPLVLLPTTSGTGSEISPYAVLTVNDKKKFYTSSELLPTIAIIDPVLAAAMPGNVTAATAFDAMTHALEGNMACPVPYTECLAVESAALVFQFLPIAVKDGSDIEARYYLSMASVMGMLSYVMGGGLYAHSISYILTTEKQQPHGVGCGLALPFTMAFNEVYIGVLLDRLGSRCFGRDGTKELRRRVIENIRELYIQSGFPETLETLGYTMSDSGSFAANLLGNYERIRNPRKMHEDEAKLLFESMFVGQMQYF